MQLAVSSSLDQRSADILALVRQAFVDKGFDGASMQDLARAAGMSVGNFYRYFPSKSAIVLALIDYDLSQIQRDFQLIIQAPQPMSALREGLRQRIDGTICDHDHDLWTEIEATARRSPEIGAAAHRMEQAAIDAMLAVFVAETGLPVAEVVRRFTASAAFVVLLFKSGSCLRSQINSDQSELKSMIIRSIDQTLDAVLTAARPAKPAKLD